MTLDEILKKYNLDNKELRLDLTELFDNIYLNNITRKVIKLEDKKFNSGAISCTYNIVLDDYKNLDYIAHTRLTYMRDEIKQICSKESSDINIGFDLGKLYNNLTNIQIEFWEILDNIKQ